jgi:acetate---CoA ligase (ADP-forming)
MATSSPAGLEKLLRPESIAVIGASGDPKRIGGRIVDELRRFGYRGRVYPINPKYQEICGFRCFPNLAAIPVEESIDMAIVYLSIEGALAAMDEIAARGIRAAVVITAGFAEVGAEGTLLQERLVQVARDHGIALCGPNTAGIANFSIDLVAYGTTSFDDLHEIVKGPVALVSQSGGMGNAIFTFSQERRVGYSHLVGSGNEALITAADYLEHLIEDPAVGVFLGFIEGIRDPDRFFRAADRAVELGKPIVVLKGGRSETGREAVLSHTAALGGSPQAYEGAFRQHGVVQVKDLADLVEAGMLFSRIKPTIGRRLGVLSLPGGGTGLVSDIAADHGFEVPQFSSATVERLAAVLPPIATVRNPVDPTAGFGRDSEKLQAALRIMAEDPGVDILVFFPLAGEVDYSQKLANDLVAVRDQVDKPVVCIWTAGAHLAAGAYRTLNEAGIPLFHVTDEAFKALAWLREYAEFRERNLGPGASDLGPAAGRTANPAAGAQRLLHEFGIRTPRSQVAVDANAAVALAAEIGGPVALKIASADVAHKSDVGGVVLGVAGETGVRAAFESVITEVRRQVPGARIDGVEVQEMVPEGVEVLVGVYCDDQLGPMLTVGLGGIFTEALHDVSIRPVPISRADAVDMLAQLKGARVLAGMRGRPAADTEALVDLMLRVSALADALRDHLPELDLNPVVALARGEGVLALDVLFRLGRP